MNYQHAQLEKDIQKMETKIAYGSLQRQLGKFHEALDDFLQAINNSATETH